MAQVEIWCVTGEDMLVAQQNRVIPSPFDYGLWTFDLDLNL